MDADIQFLDTPVVSSGKLVSEQKPTKKESKEDMKDAVEDKQKAEKDQEDAEEVAKPECP